LRCLANFDINFLTKILYSGFKSSRTIFQIILTSDWTSKKDVLTYFCQKYGPCATLPTSPPPQFFAITNPQGWKKSHRAVVCSPAQRQSRFLSVSVPGCAECRGSGFSVRPAILLFLSGLPVQHCSRQFFKPVALYYMSNKFWRRWFKPHDSEVKN
jgi:hypothetical protein